MDKLAGEKTNLYCMFDHVPHFLLTKVVYDTHEKSKVRINIKSSQYFASCSITADWNGKTFYNLH